MKIIFVGDIYGDSGINFFKEKIGELKAKYNPNVIIINGENIANGRGINKKIYLEMMDLGVHAITMGNWVWSNNNIFDFIEDSKIVRPANFINSPGSGFKKININGKTLLIINILGRIFMNPNLKNPFYTVDEILEKEKADFIFIDFHAEATSEKIALAHYLDGKIDALVGTHTHVPTNDFRIMPKGTLYITDVGMTGPLNGVIGVDKDLVIQRFLTGFSRPNIVADGKKQLNAVFLDLTKKIIKPIHIEGE